MGLIMGLIMGLNCLGMHGKSKQEITPLIVRLEEGERRTVGIHRLKNLRDARGAAFRQVKLFQEFSDAAVAISAADGSAQAQIVHPN